MKVKSKYLENDGTLLIQVLEERLRDIDDELVQCTEGRIRHAAEFNGPYHALIGEKESLTQLLSAITEEA